MKIVIIAAAVFVVLAGRASAQSLAPSLALLTGSGLDLGTTLVALHTIPESREANPLLSRGGTAGLIAVKAGTTAALIFAVHKLMPTHPKLARTLGFGGGVILAGVAVRNARLQ